VFGAAGGKDREGEANERPCLCIREINYVTGLNCSTESLTLP